MPHFKIDIISDAVCPWCYVGHVRLQRAIALFTKTHPASSSTPTSFSIRWHPYYLDPGAPLKGIPLRERMAQRFGGYEKVDSMQARLKNIGLQSGIQFDFDSKIGKTRDSHRLVELAGQIGEEAQGKVVLGLFEGYFEGGQDITDLQWIEKVGVQSGLDEVTLAKWRDEDGGGAEVDREAEKNKRFTNGVPNFTINAKYVIEGAQDPEEFLRVFSEIAEGEEIGKTSSKDAC